MIRILKLDAHDENPDVENSLVGARSGIRGLLKSSLPWNESFDEIIVIDHGTLACLELVRDAIAYRRENMECRISVQRIISDTESESEALLRSVAPRNMTSHFEFNANAAPALVSLQTNFEVSLRADAILLEYSA